MMAAEEEEEMEEGGRPGCCVSGTCGMVQQASPRVGDAPCIIHALARPGEAL